jgi:hypothetical protein
MRKDRLRQRKREFEHATAEKGSPDRMNPLSLVDSPRPAISHSSQAGGRHRPRGIQRYSKALALNLAAKVLAADSPRIPTNHCHACATDLFSGQISDKRKGGNHHLPRPSLLRSHRGIEATQIALVHCLDDLAPVIRQTMQMSWIHNACC